MSRPSRRLTPQQLAFLDLYINTGNATQAYLDCYKRNRHRVYQNGDIGENLPAVSKAAARTQASVMLRQPHMKAELAKRLQDRQDMMLVPNDRDVMSIYGMALRFDPAELYDQDGNPLPVHLIPEHCRRVLDGVDIQETVRESQDGTETVRFTKYRYKYPDKLRACESLARILAMGGLAPQMPAASTQTTVNVQVNSFGQDEAKRLLDMFSPKPETQSNQLESHGNPKQLTDYTLSDPVDSVSRPVDQGAAGPTVDQEDSKP
jgi:phage terminase small subunit